MNARAVLRGVCVLLLLALSPCFAAEQSFELSVPASAGDPGNAKLMRDLAQRMLPVYEEQDPLRYLANLSALQLVSGNYPAAFDTRALLRERQMAAPGAPSPGMAALFDLYTQAQAAAAADHVSFALAFTQAFRDQVPRLDNREAHALAAWLRAPVSSFQISLQRSLDQLRGQQNLDQKQAFELLWAYLSFEVRRGFGPWLERLLDEDEARRYLRQENVQIRGASGVTLYARVVRPKGGTRPLPALLEFRIDGAQGEAQASAAHGYAGVVAYVRGRRASPMTDWRGRIVPFEHDGEDARAVIDWISRQPWSDGRVGMIGDGYSGFAAWAAARQAPPALTAIATANAMAPGIDFPMQGQIFRNAAYRWAATHSAATPSAAEDEAQWQALDQAWYRSGRPYRDLGLPAGQANPVFQRWLNHPSYDRYWQKFIPFREQFADIGIPALTITGYYAERAAGALYYFGEHLRHRPKARHVLLIGPYDDAAMQPAPAAILRGYALDSAALVDLRELRYQWLDSVFKNGARPALLENRVNYEVMGANRWRHAPSLDTFAGEKLRFYLQAAASGERTLTRQKPRNILLIRQSLRLGDRSDAPVAADDAILGEGPAPGQGLAFLSEPTRQAMEFSGSLSGQLEFIVNKMDLDLHLALYEQLADGRHLRLCQATELRASYAQDRVQRHLLRAGVRQQLPFSSPQFCSRRLQPGSRLLLILNVNRRPDRQINYGSGKDVSEESLADAGAPLTIQWYGGSYVDIPVRR